MHAVGKAKGLKFCVQNLLLSCTAMSLSWLPSGVTTMHTSSICVQVAATVHACGRFVAIKQTSRHHQELPRNIQTPPANVQTPLGNTSKHPNTPRITSKRPDTTNTFQQTSSHRHHQELPANDQTPLGMTSKHPDTTNYQQRFEHRQVCMQKAQGSYPHHPKGTRYCHEPFTK